MATNKEKIEKL